MNSRWRDWDQRIAAAKAACPYMHRQLKAVEHTGPAGGAITVKIVD
jgi:hypothetical protein